jgi:glucose 1-dehydrogenase
MTSSNPPVGRALSTLLQGKFTIVTGGKSDIGKSIVEYLAELGAMVVIDYRSHPEATEELEQEIGGYGGSSLGVQANVGEPDDLQHLVDADLVKYGRLDVMVNNAGIGTGSSILSITMGPSHVGTVLGN